MFQNGFVLTATADDELARTVRDLTQRYTIMRRARSLQEAVPMLISGARWSGLVLDLGGHDQREAIGLVEQLREASPRLPMLALASQVDRTLINPFQAAGVDLALKPVAAANLASFVRRSIVHAFLPNERVSAWVDEYARIKKLTPREVQLLAYEFGNEPRRTVTRRLGVTDNTVKSQVRSLLRKFGVPTMDALAMQALREVISSQGGGAQRLLSCPPGPLRPDAPQGWSMD